MKSAFNNIFCSDLENKWIKIKPMGYFRGFELSLVSCSGQFECYKKFLKTQEEHKEDMFYSTRDQDLYTYVYNNDYFILYVLDENIIRKGIVNNNGDVLTYDNFDDAMLLPNSIILLKAKNKFGFINGTTKTISKIEYSSLDFSPMVHIDRSIATNRIAAIASCDFGWNRYYGAIDSNGGIIIPFIYDKIQIHKTHAYVYMDGKEANIHLGKIYPNIQINLHEAKIKNHFPDTVDNDDGEMDYIRSNGGDWIDD